MHRSQTLITTLRTGERLTIRPATRVDATDVAAFLNTLSEDSRWLRYHSAMPVIRSWMVWAITDIDHDGREALLAFSGHRIVGIAEWARDLEDSSDAHVAIVVDEGHRRRGIAQALLRQLAEMATHHGYDRFLASVLTVNRPVFGLIERMAPARSSTFNGDTVEVVIPLGPNGAHPDARATA